MTLRRCTDVHTFDNGLRVGRCQGGGEPGETRCRFRGRGGGLRGSLCHDPTRPHPAEDRTVTLGRDLLDRVLVVVWGWSGDTIRLISARRATARERRQYAEDINA